MANMETAEQTLGPITVPVLVNSVAIEPNTPLLRYKAQAPAPVAERRGVRGECGDYVVTGLFKWM